MKKRKQSQEPGPSAPASRIPMQSVDFLEIASTTWNNLETKIVPSSFSMN